MNLHPLWLSLKVAATATLFSFLVGVALAFLMARKDFRGKEGLDAVIVLPLVLPPTVLGYYLLVLFGKKGWIGPSMSAVFDFSFIFSWYGAVLVSAVASLPLIFKSARASFEGVDGDLENAARTLGQSELKVFLLISLPLAWRGILAGTMLAFVRAMGEFGATVMVAGNLPGRTQTLSMAVYDAIQAGDGDRATTLVMITSMTCFLILMVSGKILRQHRA